jgi:putative phosphoesterase
MKIGVISDTHDRLTTFRRALSMFQRLKVGALFHAGDFVAPFAAKLIAPDAPGMAKLPLYCCFGNNDGERAGLKKILPGVVDGTVTAKLGGKTIVMNHFIDWFKPAEIAAADIVISGHTHAIVNETKTTPAGAKLYLNPGECCGWVTDRCTVALLDTEAMTAEIVDVHE